MPVFCKHKAVQSHILLIRRKLAGYMCRINEAERRRASGFSLHNLRSMRNLYPA